MKKTLFLAIAILFTLSSHAQLNVGATSPPITSLDVQGDAYLKSGLLIGATSAAHPTSGTMLDIRGKAKIADGTQGSGYVLTSDANGLASWIKPQTLPGINIGSSAMILYNSAAQQALGGVDIGDASNLTNFKVLVNNITGATLTSGNQVYLPAGTYLFNVSIEVTDIPSGPNYTTPMIHSYFIDFPAGVRVHAVATTVGQWNVCNHGVQWFTTVAVSSGTYWNLALGRGQSGNYKPGGSAGGNGQVTVSTASRIFISKLL